MEERSDVLIIPVANGYIVQAGGRDPRMAYAISDQYVFNTLGDLFVWLTSHFSDPRSDGREVDHGG